MSSPIMAMDLDLIPMTIPTSQMTLPLREKSTIRKVPTPKCQTYDTELTESVTDNGDGFAQHGFGEDLEDYQKRSFNDSDDSMYATNLPGDSSVQGYPMDFVSHLLHQMDVGTFPLRFC